MTVEICPDTSQTAIVSIRRYFAEYMDEEMEVVADAEVFEDAFKYWAKQGRAGRRHG